MTIVALDDGTAERATIDGGDGIALDLAGGGRTAVHDLVLVGARGIRAAGTTRLERLHIAATDRACELAAGAHDVRDLAVDAGAATGVLVEAGATLTLERGAAFRRRGHGDRGRGHGTVAQRARPHERRRHRCRVRRVRRRHAYDDRRQWRAPASPPRPTRAPRTSSFPRVSCGTTTVATSSASTAQQ